MSTFAEVKASIADDLERTDLATQIDSLVHRAIEFYANKPFEFLEDTRTITALAGSSYTDIPTGLRRLNTRAEDYSPVRIQEGEYQYDLKQRSFSRIIKFANTSTSGVINEFAYRNGRFYWWSVPQRDYTIHVDGTYDQPTLAADNDQNAWTNEAEDLIKAEVKYRIARDVLRDPERAATERLARNEFKSNLLGKSHGLRRTGRLRAHL